MAYCRYFCLTNTRNAQATLGYSDRCVCCDGSPLTSSSARTCCHTYLFVLCSLNDTPSILYITPKIAKGVKNKMKVSRGIVKGPKVK